MFYASNAPEVREAYDTVTAFDAFNAALTGVFRLSTGVVSLVASLALWGVLPLLLVGAYHVITSEESLESVRARVALVVVLALEVAFTFAWPPRLGTDLAGSIARWVVPALSALLSTVVTVVFVRRRSDSQIFGAFFLFTLVNTVLQLVVYLLI